ncbi:MAG: hypothetical protein KA369_20765 [Spirochaetes bacterium]|nr:hypothetical protein [Spirochaetota bacterium]
MKHRSTRYCINLIVLATVIFCIVTPAGAQRTKSSLSAGKQRNAEKGLKDNRYFFYFINMSITNLGTDEEKKHFKEAIQRDIIAQNLYMKFMFGESFDEILKSQKILIDLYRKTLRKDIAMARQLLNGFAPAVVRTNDYLARHYLRLGYRDATDAGIDLLMADNFDERLYSMRLYRYSKAIKKVKHGKRYALFSLLQTKYYEDKKKGIGVEGVRDRKKEFGRHTYDELKKLITEASAPDRRDNLLLIHTDNYYRSKDEKSFYDIIWDKPDLTEIKEYNEYMEIK